MFQPLSLEASRQVYCLHVLGSARLSSCVIICMSCMHACSSVCMIPRQREGGGEKEREGEGEGGGEVSIMGSRSSFLRHFQTLG